MGIGYAGVSSQAQNLDRRIGALRAELAEWDRATRSMMDGIKLIERINVRGALLKVLDKPQLDLTTPLGRRFIAFLSAMAEDERERITRRAHEGSAAARRTGAHIGKSCRVHQPP